MKSIHISYWAANNPQKARFYIVLLSFLACLTAFEFGLWAEKANTLTSTLILLISISLGLWAWFSQSQQKTSKRLKIGIIYLITFVLWGHLGNQSISMLPDAQEAKSVVLKEASVVAPVKPLETIDKKVRGFFKKHLLKRQQGLRKVFGGIGDMDPVAVFFLFFLFGLLAIFLTFFLVVVSYSLSGSGLNAASYIAAIGAIISALGSLFFIGFGIYLAVKKSNERKK
jgi:hypothetical protein